MNNRITANHDGGALRLRHIFGMNCDIRQESQLKDHKILFYTAGQYLVKYNMEDKSQDFSRGFAQFSSITAMCLSNQKE